MDPRNALQLQVFARGPGGLETDALVVKGRRSLGYDTSAAAFFGTVVFLLLLSERLDRYSLRVLPGGDGRRENCGVAGAVGSRVFARAFHGRLDQRAGRG